jgi:hypothetical protein
MIAITNNTWIIEPAEYAKKPIAQHITKMTAMMYNRFVMVLLCLFHKYPLKLFHNIVFFVICLFISGNAIYMV